MSNIPAWLRPIQDAAGGKPVLLVEGPDDVKILTHFLSQHAPGWDSRLHLAAAGGKKRVIQAIEKHRPDWIGVVDRDEGDPAEVEEKSHRIPHLFILPRFCIESYFCVPEEIWQVLPPDQRERLGGDIAGLKQCLEKDLSDWVAHGAMWRVLKSKREALLDDLGFPKELTDRPVTDRNEIRRILQSWHHHLEPDALLSAYDDELDKAQSLSAGEQLRTYIHGKKFFRQVVVQCLDRLFSGRGVGDWLDRFIDAPIQPPSDLTALLDRILALL